jgi:predicted porin
MNKKLLAVAVAGALAAPGVAFAQSTVTISGFIKQGLENYSVSNSNAGRLNNSQMRLVDSASRIYFNSTEDLGNGLKGIMQVDLRIMANNNVGVGGAGVGLDGGNTYVGLKSATLGELTMGRRDLHYMVATMPVDDTASVAGPLQAVPTSIMDFIGSHGVGVGSQANTVKYETPNWSGFSGVLAWSANVEDNNRFPGQLSDMNFSAPGVASRKGDAWNFAPQYVNGPFGIGYSYWRNKYDSATAGEALADERADTLWGYYKFGGFKIGLGWNKIKLEDAVLGGEIAHRQAWTIPMSYTWGPHNIAGHYSVARNAEGPGGNMGDTGARMGAIAYSYSFSKRTSVGLTYAKINNDKNINYNFFTSNGFGTPVIGGGVQPGESPRMIQATIAHSF